MDNEISAVMTATMSKIKEMVDTNTVVGEPITTPDDITLIPLSRVSFAFASGGSEFPMKENKNGVGCGSGAGVKVEPMGFLIVKDGNGLRKNLFSYPYISASISNILFEVSVFI